MSTFTTDRYLEIESNAHHVTVRTAAWGVAAVLIAAAAYLHQGTYGSASLLLLLLTVIAAVSALFWPCRAPTGAGPTWVMLACLIAELFASASGFVSVPLKLGSILDVIPIAGCVAAAGVLAGALWFQHGKAAALLFAGVVALVAWICVWTIRHMPSPQIDVYFFQQASAEALLHRMNPYSLVFPDIYNASDSALFYGQGVSQNGTLLFGYPYTPLPLLLAVPGYLLGDVRYAHLAAMLLTGIVLAYGLPSRTGRLAGCLLLLAPQSFRVLGMCWTEPFSVMLLAAVVVTRKRMPRLLPYLLGLLLASKQYMVILLPLIPLLQDDPRSLRGTAGLAFKALLTAAVVSLPLMIWNLPDFLHSAVFLQFHQPFRPDSLSFMVYFRPDNPAHWTWIPFVACGFAACLLLVVARKREVGFAAASGIVFLVFFALNKQAFANYYYLVFGAFCCACVELNTPGRRDASKDNPLPTISPLPTVQ